MKIRNDSRGNSRAQKLLNFLATHAPRNAHLLVLSFVVEERREVIASWEPEQVSLELAALIDQECSDLADEIACQVSGSLAWVDQSGETLTQKALRVRPNAPSHDFAGTSLDQARQAQTHLEAMARVFVGSIHEMIGALQTTLSTQTEIMQRMAQRTEQTEEREQDASEVIDAMQSEIYNLREQLTEAAREQHGSEKEDRIYRLIEGAITAHLKDKAAA